MADWRDKVILNPGETLRVDSSRCEGFMQETDIYECSILNSVGDPVGKVEVTDHTAVRGFRRTLSVRQISASGKVIVDETWTA